MRLNTNHWLAIGAIVLSVLWLASGMIFDFGGEEAEVREEPEALQVVVQTLDYQPIPGGVSISGLLVRHRSEATKEPGAGPNRFQEQQCVSS